MGRKSEKSKQRKQQRLEKHGKISEAQALVDSANQLEDPLTLLPGFRKFDRNGCNFIVECQRVSQVPAELMEWAFDLCRLNMQIMYDANGGWSDKAKRAEMTHDLAWYLIARDEQSKPQGFVHFRFDLDYDRHVLYCYEIQLESDARRKGLGKFFMQILELLAFKTKMQKVVLTVFKDNVAAQKFFKEKLKYEVDETDPNDFDFALNECFGYEILSKKIAIPQ